MQFFGKITEIKQLKWRDPNGNVFFVELSPQAADRTATVPVLDANDVFVFTNQAQILTNKTIPLGSGNSVMGITDTVAGYLGVSEDVQAFIDGVRSTTGMGTAKGDAWAAMTTTDVENLAGTTSNIQEQLDTNTSDHGGFESRIASLESGGGGYAQATLVNTDQVAFSDTSSASLVFVRNDFDDAVAFDLREVPSTHLTYQIKNTAGTLTVSAGTNLIGAVQTIDLGVDEWVWLRWDGTIFYVAAQSSGSGGGSSELIELTASANDTSTGDFVFVQANSATSVTFTVAVQPVDSERIYQFKNGNAGSLSVDLTTNGVGAANRTLVNGEWVWLAIKTVGGTSTVFVMDQSPVSSASSQFEFVSGEALNDGDAVYLSSTGKVVKAAKLIAEEQVISELSSVKRADNMLQLWDGSYLVMYNNLQNTTIEAYRDAGAGIELYATNTITTSFIPEGPDTARTYFVQLTDTRILMLSSPLNVEGDYHIWATLLDFNGTAFVKVYDQLLIGSPGDSTYRATLVVTRLSDSSCCLLTLEFPAASQFNAYSIEIGSASMVLSAKIDLGLPALALEGWQKYNANRAVFLAGALVIADNNLLLCAANSGSAVTDFGTYALPTDVIAKAVTKISDTTFVVIGYKSSDETFWIGHAVWNLATGVSFSVSLTSAYYTWELTPTGGSSLDSKGTANYVLSYDEDTQLVQGLVSATTTGTYSLDDAGGTIFYAIRYVFSTTPPAGAFKTGTEASPTARVTAQIQHPSFIVETSADSILVRGFFGAMEITAYNEFTSTKLVLVSSPSTDTVITPFTAPSTSARFLGFSRTTVGAADLPVDVVMGPVITGFTDLTPYRYYYSAGDGEITTYEHGDQWLIGLATTTTAMIVKAFGS